MLNENSLFDAWVQGHLHPVDAPGRDPNFRAPTARYSAVLDRLYQEYLARTLGPDGLARWRPQLGLAADAPVPRLRPKDFAAAPQEQFQTEAAFYTAVERGYYRDMHHYLKEELGVGSLLLGSNDHPGDKSFYPMLWANTEMDVIDGHAYWQHPTWPGPGNTPQVNDPVWSTIVRLSRSAVAGKPYTVSEVNHAFPNDWLCEGIPTLAAYAGLQDWDAVMWYTFEPKRDPQHRNYVGDAFDLSLDPVRMPQLTAGALSFLRGDVAPGRETIVRNYSAAQTYESLRLPRSAGPLFTPDFPADAFLQHKVRIGSFDGPATPIPVPATTSPVVSDTGELSWLTNTAQTGLVTVNTERAQALVGFVSAHAGQLTHLAVEVENRFCAVQLTSLEDRPIATASRLLLITGARVENTGTQWNVNRTLAQRNGAAPSVIEPVRGKIHLTNLRGAKQVTLTALDGAGGPLGSVDAIRHGDVWELPVGAIVTPWYEISVQR